MTIKIYFNEIMTYNIIATFQEIQNCFENNDYLDVLDKLDDLVKKNPNFLKTNFYSIQINYFKLKEMIFYLKKDMPKWVFYALVCLSKNFNEYFKDYQDAFFEHLQNIEKFEISILIFSNSLAKYNKLYGNLKESLYNIDEQSVQSFNEEFQTFQYFSCPFNVEAFFDREYFINGKPFKLKILFTSSLLKEFEFDELFVILSVLNIDKEINEEKVILVNEPTTFIPQHVKSYEKELIFSQETRAITIKHAVLTLGNLTLLLFSNPNPTEKFIKVTRIPDISNCDFKIDFPHFGITNVPFPISMTFSIRSCQSPYQIGYQISPFQSQQYIVKLNPEETVTEVQNIIETNEQIDNGSVLFVITSDQSVYPFHLCNSFTVPFKHPFHIISNFFDSNGNKLSQTDLFYTDSQYIITFKIGVKIDVPVLIQDIECEFEEEYAFASIIPIDYNFQMDKNELFTVSLLLQPKKQVENKSLCSIKIIYSPLKYFNSSNSFFYYSLPSINVIEKIISVQLDFPTLNHQYHAHKATLLIKNESSSNLILMFDIGRCNDIMIEGFVKNTFPLSQNEAHVIAFTFYPLRIGEMKFPKMQIKYNKNIIWKDEPNLFVTFPQL